MCIALECSFLINFAKINVNSSRFRCSKNRSIDYKNNLVCVMLFIQHEYYKNVVSLHANDELAVTG